MRRGLAALALALLLASSCARGREPAATSSVAVTTTPATSSPTQSPRATVTPTPARTSAAQPEPELPRIAVLVLENKEYDDVIGNPNAPYINRLAKSSALATRFFAITHPSLPNYLALLSGKRFDVGDCTDCHFDVPSLVDQMETSSISWKAYIEGYPGDCFTGPSRGRYAKKHNPFVYLDDVVANPKRCAKIVSTDALTSDLRARKLPRFTWITPDMCNDAHDCPIATADRFVQGIVPKIVGALGPHGVLVLTFDEGRTTAGCCEKANGGHIVTIVTGPGAHAGKFEKDVDLYSLLRLVEDRWKLPHLGDAGCPCTPSMGGMLR